MTESLNPWPQGDTISMTITLQTDSGAGVSLVGLNQTNLQMLIKNVGIGNPSEVTGLGSFAIQQYTAPAIVVYTPNATDSATVGTFELRVQVTGPTYVRTVGPYSWNVVVK